MADIISNTELWEGHTHQEVEQHIKQRFADMEGTTVQRIGVSVVGSYSKNYVKSEELVQFDYIVTNTDNGVSNNDFQVHMVINDSIVVSESLINSMINYAGWHSGATITSPNLFSLVKDFTTSFKVAVYVTSGENVSGTRTVTFSSTICKISTADVAILNPTQLSYVAEYDTTDSAAHVKVAFVNQATGDSTVINIANLVGSNDIANVRIGNPLSGTDENGNSYTLGKGTYDVNAQLYLGDDTASNVLKTAMLVTSGAGTGEPFVTAALASSNGRYNEAKILVLPYIQGASSVDVTVLIKDAYGSYNEYTSFNVMNGNTYEYSYLVPYVDNSVRFVVNGTGGYSGQEASEEVNFSVSDSSVDWQATAGPLIKLSAQGRSNSSNTKDVWESNGYEVEFEDVPFNDDSGWINQRYLKLNGSANCHIKGFYPFYRNSSYQAGLQGGGILDTGMSLLIRFAVTDVSDKNTKVISCFSEEDGIGFYVTGDGIYVNLGVPLVSRPETDPSLDTTNVRKFVAGSPISFAITVQPYYQNSVQTKHEVRYYINGELAGFNILDGVTDFNNFITNPQLLKFGDSKSSLQLYDVTYYDKYLTPFEVLQTTTMNLDSAELMLQVYNKNNFYSMRNGNPVFDFNSAIKYGKWLAEQGKKDFAVWCSTNMCNGAAYMNNTKEHAQPGQVERIYMFRFTTDVEGKGIIDAENTFMVEGTYISGSNNTLRFRRQGTSTASATKGNERVDVRGDCGFYKWDAVANMFGTSATTVTKGAKIWKIGNAMPCYLLTCKKNPNDSTHARNLPTAKWVEECCRALAEDTAYADCLTEPQRVELASIMTSLGHSRATAVHEIKTRQCIDGIPSVAFEVARLDDEDKLDMTAINDNSSFAGQFDLITDKTNMDVFGFGGHNMWDSNGNVEFKTLESLSIEDEDYSIELRTNSSHVTTFHECNLEGQGELSTEAYDASVSAKGTTVITEDDIAAGYSKNSTTCFQYRYPNDDRLTVPGRTKGLLKTDTIQKLWDLVYSCAPRHIGYVAVNGEAPVRATTYEAYGDSFKNPALQADRNAVFKANVVKLVNINQTLVTAIALDRGLMMDQDAKNQFFTHFSGDGDSIRVNWLGVANQTIQKLCLPGYDFDTSWQTDNNNLLRLAYDTLYSDDLYDSSLSGQTADAADYNVAAYGCYSDFWKLIFDNFADEIKTMAGILYQKQLLTPDNILTLMHTNQVDYYNSIIFNANSEYSYTSLASDYEKSHGSAKEHNEYFVKGRLTFKAGETYAPNDGSGYDSSPFKARLDTSAPSSASLVFTPKERDYIYAGFSSSGSPVIDAGGFANVRNIYGSDNLLVSQQRTNLTLNLGNVVGGGDNTLYIVGGAKVAKVEGLQELRIANIVDWGDMVNMEELSIGRQANPTYSNTAMSSGGLGFSSNVVFGSCTMLDLSGLSGTNMTDVTLTGFTVLETLYLKRMTNLRSATLPWGSTLKAVYLPAYMTSLVLDNKTRLASLAIETAEGQSFAGETLSRISVTDSNAYAANVALDLLINFIG